MEYVNLTPHIVRLNSGMEFPPSGEVARVSSIYTGFDENLVCEVVFGDVINVPEPREGVIYIVSALVSAALPDRMDVVSPATSHPLTVRKDGQPYSVPGFVKA